MAAGGEQLQNALKKPTSAYWMWLGDNRERIASMLGTSKGSEVSKKAGEMWKTLADSEKAPYEKKAKEQKDAYDKFIATEEGQKALGDKKLAQAEAKAEADKKQEEKKEKLAAKEEKKNERACKAAVKAVEKDDALKKPQTAYWLWLGDNRERITKMIGSSKGPEVSKKAGELWKTLADSEKQPYEMKAKEQKDAYDRFVKSEEGAAKLKAFKDAQQAAKAQFKPTEDPEEEKIEEKEVSPQKASPKKRGNPNQEAVPAAKRGRAAKTPTPEGPNQEAVPAAKRGRAAKTPTPEGPSIPEAVLKEAEGLNMVSALKNLMARPEVIAAGKTPKQMLSTLASNGGLVNKAKAALLGA